MLERFHVPEADQIRVPPEALRATVERIFMAVGVPEEDARQGADVLVYADLRGVETHGVSNMLRVYVQQYRTGQLNPTPELHYVIESPSGLVIDGDRGLGLIQCPKVMRLVIEKAREQGVATASIRNLGHTGPIGYHAMLAAQQDMVGLSMTASGSQVLPALAAEPRMGTNPIAVAAPAGERPWLLFDAAMSAIASNKIRIARRLGVPLHPGWVASWTGTPIMEETPVPEDGDFHQLPLGSTRELGAHKGFGLALMVEVLATLLSGSVPRMLDPEVGSRHFLAAFDIAAFTDVERFKQTMDDMLGMLLETKPAPGAERVIYPGVAEAETLAERSKNGIPYHREVIEWFDQVTAELNIERLERL
ncbi:MAG TPA: Ldh family oxidoreductase [Thermomicrobiales bacterium]|nr:Ldh family oxidoreductase [Thermomicrobiales bacterium]